MSLDLISHLVQVSVHRVYGQTSGDSRAPSSNQDDADDSIRVTQYPPHQSLPNSLLPKNCGTNRHRTHRLLLPLRAPGRHPHLEHEPKQLIEPWPENSTSAPLQATRLWRFPRPFKSEGPFTTPGQCVRKAGGGFLPMHCPQLHTGSEGDSAYFDRCL